MHFKTAVILFALYFVTATQSVGLNMRQIEIIDYLFTIHCVGNIFKGENVEIELRNCMKNFSHSENEEEHENCIDDSSMEDIVKMGLEISMNSILDFEYKEGRTDAQQVQDLLVFLANTEKKFDDFTSQSFSSYEITVFVGLFNKCDQSGKHDGLLDYKEVIQVIDALNLEKCVKENLEGAFEEDETFNAAEFLYEFLKVKPEGRGLEMYQVQEMIDLHKNHKIKGDHIDPVEIKNMFTKLSIVNDDYEGLLVFHPNPTRKGPLELQELLIVLAEYNKVADINAKAVCPTIIVRSVVWDFSEHDVDQNGELDKKEFEEMAKHLTTNKDVDSLIRDNDTDKDGHLDITEFFMLIFTELVK